MKYYLTEISTGEIANGKPSAKAIYEYGDGSSDENRRLAVANFHIKLGQAMKSPLFDTELCMVTDEKGTVVSRGYDEKPKPEPEPEPEEVGEIE